MSFLANPDREAVAPDGTSRHIRLVRGNAWLGRRWSDRVLNAPGGGDDGDVIVVAPGPDGSARTAEIDERLPTKPEAADQAMRHLAEIRSGSWAPRL